MTGSRIAIFPILVLSAIIIFAACGFAQTNALPPPPSVYATPKEPKLKLTGVRELEVDEVNGIALWITEKREIGSVIRYSAAATYKQKNIGFLVDIPAGESEIAGDIVFRSAGAISDDFLEVLATVYGLKSEPVKFAGILKVDFVDLDEFGKKLGVVRVRPSRREFKLFLGRERDIEMFLNVDEKAGKVELCEKDVGYREGIIENLSKTN